MKLKKVVKKLVALGLAAALIAADIPIMTHAEDTPTTTNQQIYDKDGEKETAQSEQYNGETYISDSNTINGWKNLFTENSTEYAGAVWTDKAVFTSDESETEIPSDLEDLKIASMGSYDAESGEITMTTSGTTDVTVENENFLVAMSALGSTKQITGYSALPSDTVFVLDLSNSMSSESLSRMVEATNKAIEKLLKVNNYNRIGVVVYDTDTQTLLPIDRYTTTETATDSEEKTYPVYIELIELENSNEQLVTARTYKEETTYPTANEISDQTLNSIANNIPDRNRYEQGSNYRQRVAGYLEQQLSTSVVGIDINWNSELQGERASEYEDWTTNQWVSWINDVIEEAEGIPVVTSTNVSNLKGSDGELVSASVNVGGGTYIQGGLNSALNLFKAKYDANDTAIDTGLIQGGTARIPITVLMTDGAPTYGSSNYTASTYANQNLGNGNASSTTDAMVFPTQLTAAYLRQKMEEYYGRESLFYTLGLGDINSYALSVLNPENNRTENLNNYWTYYENTAQGRTINGYSYGNHTITRLEGATDTLTNYRYYVDQYFPASGSEDLVNAFDAIVEAIIIQSRYYPTLVENNAQDFEGYLTFEDEIGEFMEVKDVKGIVLGDAIFTGQAFLNALNNSTAFGNASQWSSYGEELMKSISKRIGIQDNEARTLLAAAYRAGGTNADGTPANREGQLWTENYIGWYADATGAYLGHWDDELHTEENYPADAKYLIKSYIFFGDLSSKTSSNVAGGDMMHIVVQVYEEIETGNQCVIWKIPANLIPLVTYDISVDTNSLDTAEDISMTVDIEQPIRLLYEVGLDESINEVNMASVVGAGHHSHPLKDSSNKTIGYAFYSNRWGAGHTLDGSGDTDVLDPTAKLATVSHFHPSEQNERYYYTEDSFIYSDKEGTTVYKGTEKPSGDDYYRVYRIIEKDGDTYKVTKKVVPIAAAVLAATGDMEIQRINDASDTNNGAWYIPAGQIYQQIARHQQAKTDGNSTAAGKDGTDPDAKGNVTQTISYYDYPVVVARGEGESYSIYDFLGNNGRLIKYLEAGIQLTKTLDDNTAAGTVEFTFEVAFANGTNMSDLKLHDAEGNDITEASKASGKLAVNGTKATVKIENSETVYFTGISVGTKYTVSEVITRDPAAQGYDPKDYTVDDNYAVKDVTFNGTSAEFTSDTAKDGTVITATSTTPEYTITEYTIDAVQFINTKSSHKGDLKIEKLIEHPYGDDYVIPSDLSFEIVVDLGSELANTEFAATGSVRNGQAVDATLKTDAAGKITLNLGAEDSVIIKDIPEGTEYKVIENLAADSAWSTTTPERSGMIISDTVAKEVFVNKLTVKEEADSSDVQIQITKDISGAASWENDWEFDFIVERYNADTEKWENILGNETFTVTAVDKEITVSGTTGSPATPRVEFDEIGQYYYRISEVVPTNGITGITYDTTSRYFYFDVTDENMDGVLELATKNYYGTIVTTAGNVTTVAAKFTNYFAQAVAEITLDKDLVNATGVDIPMNSFTFNFCEANHVGNPAGCPKEQAHLTLKPNVEGKLTFPQTYTTANLADVSEWYYEGTLVEIATIPVGATKSKTFTYYLWETNSGKIGMTYDSDVYKVDVKVVVTKGAESDSVAVESVTLTNLTTGATSAEAEFDNEFTLRKEANVPLAIQKTLNGHKIDEAGFTFNVYKTSANFSTNGVTPAEVKVTNENLIAEPDKIPSVGLKSGMELFALTGTEVKAGTYYFVISEKTGENPAITYDSTVYYVTAVVAQGTGDSEGALVIQSVTVNECGGAVTVYGTPEKPIPEEGIKFDFENDYNIIQNAEVVIQGDKDLTGKALIADEFTFGLYKDAACTSPVKDADGNPIVAKNVATSGTFTFETLTFDAVGEHTYYVKEVVPSPADEHITYDSSVYQVVIKVTDETPDGILEVTQTVSKVTPEGAVEANLIKFTNTYTPDPVEVSFTGEKQYVDESNTKIAVDKWPQSGFNFKLYVADSNFNMTDDVALTVSHGHKFTGTYTNNSGDVEFVGSQSAISVGTDVAPFELDLEFPAAGSYYFILKEEIGTEASLQYDTREYRISVIVTDYAGSGKLTVSKSMVSNGENASVAAFKNMLIEQAVDVQLKVTKELANSSTVNLPLDNFKFGMYTDEACTDLVATSVAAESKDASFNLQYTNKQLVDADVTTLTETYYIKEIIPEDGNKLAGVTYDNSVYKVVVTVTYDENGILDGYDTITQIIDKDGNPIENPVVDEDNEMTFNNGYDLADASFAVSGTKSLTGKALTDNQFTFALYGATVTTDESGVVTGWTVGDQIGENAANVGGTFRFAAQTYDTEGSYYYVVKENAGTDDNVTYDGSEYLVRVDVANGGRGALVATSTVMAKKVGESITWATNAQPLSVAFANEYTPDPQVVEITGIKVLDGGRNAAIEAGEFTFALYETGNDYEIPANATPIKTVQNTADRGFEFTAETVAGEEGPVYVTSDRLYFETEGTRYFVIKEVPGTDPTITYNPTEYNVKVEVTHNKETGLLEQKVTAIATGKSSVEIRNIYTEKEASAEVAINKTLNNITGVDYEMTNFQFALYEDSGCTIPYTGSTAVVSAMNTYGKAAVTFKYTDVDYNARQAYVYYLKEIAGNVSGMGYDSTVYEIVVNLSYNAAKELVATPVIKKVGAEGTVTAADFTNTYNLGSVAVDITGAKEFNNWTDSSAFTVELYKTDETGNHATGKKLAEDTVTNTDKTYLFDANSISALNFSTVGTYYFAVRENLAGTTDTANNIVYDGKQYVVKVEVTAKEDKTGLEATATITQYAHGTASVGSVSTDTNGKVTATIPAFNNLSYSDKLVVAIQGKKAVEGRTIKDQEFHFDLYTANENWVAGSYVGVVNTGENFKFDIPLEKADTAGTYYYVLKEADTGNPTITYDRTEYRIKIETGLIENVASSEAVKVEVKAVEVTKVAGNDSATISNAWSDNEPNTIYCYDSKDDKAVTFTNKYDSQKVDAEVAIDKTIVNHTGVEISEEGFVFGMYTDSACTKELLDSDGKHITATTKADGKATIKLPFNDTMYDESVNTDHVYTYYLKEIAGDKAGMTYDNAVYKVDVKLQFVDDKLTAVTTVSDLVTGASAMTSTNVAAFVNTYDLNDAKVSLEGAKELDGHIAYKSNFIFDMFKATVKDGDWTYDENKVVMTARNDYQQDEAESGDFDKFVFADLTFDKAGTYHYVVKEREGKVGGVTYDDSEYRITITVVPDDADDVDDGEKGMDELIATVSMTKVDGEDSGNATKLVFNNTYVPKGSFSIDGSKVLYGREWRDSDSFEFELYKAEDSDFTLDRNAKPVATATVKGTDEDYIFEFENVALEGAGEHYFVLKEADGNAKYMDYDEFEHKFVVNTTDNLDGTLSVDEAELDKLELNFYNEYLTDEVKVDIEGTKELTPTYGNREIEDKEFYFGLYNATAQLNGADKIVGWTVSDMVGEAVPNDGNGFEFKDIAFTKEGVYYFAVRELPGTNDIITYDTTEHRIKVVVTDIGDTNMNKKANLKAEVFYIDEAGNEAELKDQIAFENIYNDTKVTIDITKLVTCTGDLEHKLDGFKFQVKNVTTDTVYSSKAVTDGKGHTTFTILYDERDIGKTYEYEISEIDTNIADMEYDTTVYNLKVTLSVVDGKLVATTVVDDEEVDEVKLQFTNTYNGKTPEKPDPEKPGKDPVIPPTTGDNGSVVMYLSLTLVSALYIAVLFFEKKKKTAKTK